MSCYIPNAFTVLFVFAGIVYNAYGSGASGVVHSLVGMVVGGGLLLIPYLWGGFGAGDVKLVAAIGSWVGAVAVAQIFVIGAVILGVVSACLLMGNRVVRQEAWLNL